MSNLTIEEALKTLKESCCEMCTYGARGMDDCVIHSCNKRDAIRALEQDISELKQERNKSEDPDLTIEEKFYSHRYFRSDDKTFRRQLPKRVVMERNYPEYGLWKNCCRFLGNGME